MGANESQTIPTRPLHQTYPTTKFCLEETFTHIRKNVWFRYFLVEFLDIVNDAQATIHGISALHPAGGQHGEENNGQLHCYLKHYHEGTHFAEERRLG